MVKVALVVSIIALAVCLLTALHGVLSDGLKGLKQRSKPSRVPIKQYLQKFPKWGRFGVTSVMPFLLLPVHPEGCTPAHRT